MSLDDRPDAETDSDGGSWVHKILAAGMQTTESQTVKAGKKGEGFDLKDGKYTGSANGYGGKITVTVTIKNKKIVKIHIDSRREKRLLSSIVQKR